MTESQSIGSGSPSALRVDTLVRLRWLAVAGQAGAVLVARFLLGFDLPLGFCFLFVALSAWVNIGLRLRLPRTHRLSVRPAAALLGYDILQLAALLYLTGGLQNPFSMLFLAPVMISATSLPGRATIALGLFTGLIAGVLVFAHRPLPWFPGEAFEPPFFYSVAVWCSIVIGAAFIGVYASRVAAESQLLADALAATDLVLQREQHLSQLDGLAAAAAHELGTPLATITVVVNEWLRAKAGQVPGREDIELVAQEAARCRAILKRLSSLDSETSILSEMTLGQLIEEVAAPHRNFGVEIVVSLDGEGAEPICRRNPGLIYGLGNLIENAVDFARERVAITARWNAGLVNVEIVDDGPGFPSDIRFRVGEPYLRARDAERRMKSGEGGLGLGLFIAKTLLERGGASFRAGNPEGGGARVALAWRRDEFSAGVESGGARAPTPHLPLAASIPEGTIRP